MSLMQRAAIYGLFVTVRDSSVGTRQLERMLKQSPSDGVEFTYNGRIAAWTTRVASAQISWEVSFKDVSLGRWNFFLGEGARGEDIRWLEWRSGRGNGYVERNEIHFDDDTFTRMFEAFRLACAAYIRHYRFSVSRDKLLLIDGILAP